MVNCCDIVLIRHFYAGCRILFKCGMADAFINGIHANDLGLRMVGKC